MSRHGLLPHALWTLLAIASAASLWWAYSVRGAIGIFVCMGVAFALWHWLGSRGSWMLLIVLGFGMCGVLTWETVHATRCPPGDTKVFLEADEPPVGCSEMRASTGSMAVLFGIMGIVGIAAPLYARSLPDDDELDVDQDPGAAPSA